MEVHNCSVGSIKCVHLQRENSSGERFHCTFNPQQLSRYLNSRSNSIFITSLQIGFPELSQLHPNAREQLKKCDPAEYSILVHPKQFASLTQRDYQGAQREPPSEARRLERSEVGVKESTGFLKNTIPLVEPRDRDSARFSTHYQNKYVLYYILLGKILCKQNTSCTTKFLGLFDHLTIRDMGCSL